MHDVASLRILCVLLWGCTPGTSRITHRFHYAMAPSPVLLVVVASQSQPITNLVSLRKPPSRNVSRLTAISRIRYSTFATCKSLHVPEDDYTRPNLMDVLLQVGSAEMASTCTVQRKISSSSLLSWHKVKTEFRETPQNHFQLHALEELICSRSLHGVVLSYATSSKNRW
jgi:hypothetical protein